MQPNRLQCRPCSTAPCCRDAATAAYWHTRIKCICTLHICKTVGRCNICQHRHTHFRRAGTARCVSVHKSARRKQHSNMAVGAFEEREVVPQCVHPYTVAARGSPSPQ
eukprot:1149081-Pelagomonas_calceolata.AAC.3